MTVFFKNYLLCSNLLRPVILLDIAVPSLKRQYHEIYFLNSSTKASVKPSKPDFAYCFVVVLIPCSVKWQCQEIVGPFLSSIQSTDAPN